MKTRSLILAAVLLFLAGAAAHYALAGVAQSPRDEPLIITKGMWVDLIFVLGSRNFRDLEYDSTTNIATLYLSESPGKPEPALARKLEAARTEQRARLRAMLEPVFPDVQTRLVLCR